MKTSDSSVIVLAAARERVATGIASAPVPTEPSSQTSTVSHADQTTSPAALHRLVATRISHHFGKTPVLRDVSLRLEPGRILCLVGPSGCGKSTLLRLIAGLERVQSGVISIDGALIADVARHCLPEKRDVGLVFQDFALFPHMSLADNVAFGLGHLPRAERRKLALDMLSRVGLAERADDPPHILSGGQQQRVALARALAPQPSVMLLDEPFSNLDVRLRHRMRVDTLRLLRDSGAACIMVTHDPEEAMFMADEIALMHEGSIVQIGAPRELYRHPASLFAAEFFGEVNRIDGVVEHGVVVTPCGPIDPKGFPDGTRVRVLIRPEAIRVVDPQTPGAVLATATASRMLGASTLVALQLGRDGLELQAALPSSQQGFEARKLHVQLDAQGVFVFPREDA